MVLEMTKLVQLNDFWREYTVAANGFWGYGKCGRILLGWERHIEGEVVIHHRLWFDF